MLTPAQLKPLSPRACKIYILFHALARDHLLTATYDHLARLSALSKTSIRTAVAELLSARLIARLPRLARIPSTYLLCPQPMCQPVDTCLSSTDSSTPIDAPNPLPNQDASPFPPSPQVPPTDTYSPDYVRARAKLQSLLQI